MSRLSTLSLPHLNLSLLVPVRAPSQRILNHKTPRPPLNQRSTANKFTLVSFISQLRFISIFNTRSFGIQQHSISEYVGPSQARLIFHSSGEGRERCSIERKGQSGGGLKIRQRELLRRGRGEFEYAWTPKRACVRLMRFAVDVSPDQIPQSRSKKHSNYNFAATGKPSGL